MGFIKAEKSIVYSSTLTSDEKIALLALSDRLSLSKSKGDIYKKNGQYFVRYSQKEMAKVIGKSERTIFAIYKRLESLNIIKRFKNRNASDSIFLPGLAKIAGPNSQNLRTNKILPSNTNTLDTDHTEMAESQNNQQAIKTPKQPVNYIKAWKESVVGKARLDNSAVDIITRYCYENGRYNLAKCREIVGLIFKAKSMVASQHGLNNNDKRTRFENNTNMDNLRIVLDNIFLHAKTARSDIRYIFSSLRNFFTKAMGFEDSNDRVTPTIINNRRGHHDVKIPDWMKKEYDPEKDKVTEEEKAEARAALERIRQMTIDNNK